ncbi:MAG: prolyl oligopeptidase family serine peptidase, partial [Trichodesmium sp. St19_bin2]|nr:prolyl oligopeptidase family serine peptidase [Trichodesmium sp. St19_bin2]
MTQIAPLGSWKSPITTDLILSGAIGLSSITIDGNNVYWIEGRPSEGGRNVIVRHTPDGKTTDITPSPFNVRTRVHEYGGGAFLVADDTIYFSNFKDQRLYRQTPGTEPQPLTPSADLRYADAVIDKQRDRLICVQEDHTKDGEPINRIVSINLKNGEDIQVLAEGYDFYASPRLSPDGSKLCWISWNHPNLPWDGTELWVAQVNTDGLLDENKFVAGGKEESIFQPQWSPDGMLCFVSDRSLWWNIYQVSGITDQANLDILYSLNAEFGVPQWVFGMSTYTFTEANKILCTFSQNGIGNLATLDTTKKHLQKIEIPFTSISYLTAKNNKVCFLGSSPTEPSSIIQINLSTGDINILKCSTDLKIDSGYLSIPKTIEFPTENGKTAYGLFYPPTNKDYTEPLGEKPPLLVKSHGGPTAATSGSLSLKIQYWTSRGFALLDVNYGGSTGYGREYRQRLKNSWGIVDVDDCVNGAQYLAKQGLVDSNRMAISGGSAGGYTTLCALTFKDVFKAG